VSSDPLSAAAPRPAPRLLVSVVSPHEVAAALAGGAQIVDVKNPSEGALGAPTPATLLEVRRLVEGAADLSVALGDAPHLPGLLALAAHAAAACGAEYIKVGLFGSVRPEQALELLVAVRQAVQDVQPRARVVAVAYADAARIGSLPPAALPGVACRAGVFGVMLDTALKDGVSTFATLGDAGVAAFVAEARSFGLTTALAGSLGLGDLERAAALGVDTVGVRGAACEGGREGVVSATRVRLLRCALANGSEPIRRAARA
jgi:uncharacterized protein (UPF0264 family)